MIKDHVALTKYITEWMIAYAASAHVDTLVLGLSGGIDSALCALLAKKTGLRLVCVSMPCHSSSSAYDRAKSFADENGIELLKVDLSAAHESISAQVTNQAEYYDWTSKGAAGGLRSCLRAPTLSFTAHATGGIIIGTGNRSEDRITRYFQKFGDGCVDFCPIADLWKSEVYDLFKFLAEEATGTMGPGSKAIYDAKPTADLWGADSGQEDEKELGITYDEIEWADREDVKTPLIFRETPPNVETKFAQYTERQQEVLMKLWKMEKVSRHKYNPNLPVCEVHGKVNSVE